MPSPTPWEDLAGNGSQTNGGTNFGVGGAGVTYAYGFRPLSQQIDQFQGLVNGNTWPANHLSNSVAVISMGVNDYTWYNQFGNGPQVNCEFSTLRYLFSLTCEVSGSAIDALGTCNQ